MAKAPVDTALYVMVGPILDDTDFKTPETGVAYNAAGLAVVLHQESLTGLPTETALTLTTAGSQDWTEAPEGGGYYFVEITVAQNNAEGRLWLSGALPGALVFESVGVLEIVPANVHAALVAGTDTLDVQVAGMDTDVIDAAALATDAVTEIVEATWQELLNQAQYSTNHMAGKHLRDAAHAGAVHDGTLQAATATTVTLTATASAVDGFYEQMRVILTDNTGAGQAAIILAYDGTSKVAKIAPTWRATPDNTTDYIVQPALVHSETSGMCLLAGYATAGGASSITLDADASSVDDFYNGQVIILHHDGAAEGQSKRILDYDGATKEATVASAWITVPLVGTQYAIKAAQIDAKDSDDYQTGPRGSGLWTSGGTSGSVVVTLHTETTLGNDVPDAGLTVRNAAGDSVITAGRSDLATSDFGLNLNPGTYLVYPLKSAHTATSPQTIVVTTGPVTFAIVIDPMTITAPTDPTLCNITGRAADAGGNFREGTIVLAKYVVPGTAQGLLGHSGGVSASTDADGNYLLPLIKTAVVEVTSAFLGYKDTQFTVPDADNQDMATWTPDVV